MKDVGNVFHLKQMLAQEVITLRTLATDREREHAQVVGRLKEQLILAKTQLTVARNEAATDAVTGVTNRRGFDRSLADYIRDAHPTTPLVLALFDVDGFKAINDTYGHPTGDVVLRDVASAIRESVRQEDVVGRIGGDEFAVIAIGMVCNPSSAEFAARSHPRPCLI